GVAGAAIALALKDSLGNVAGGIMILVTKPFSQNDYIDIGGTTGTVKHIDLLLTTLKTYDNKVITIPNGMVTTSVLTNYTREELRRVDCVFGIGFNDDLNHAKDLMLATAQANGMILDTPEPFIGVAGNSDNSVDVDFRVWCKTEDYWDVKYFLEENIKLAFDEAGICIPFPQMDIHLKK
ncbi:MAG: mechanosensitive ion channel family protein, partial [Anaerovoracaceae bacterium]